MPDWSYQTVLKPLLFAMPPLPARDLSLGLMGALGRSPVGPAVIDFLGHMRPAEALRRERLGFAFASPVGLGCGLDPEGRATAAFARFGVGLIEIGPITVRPSSETERIERIAGRQSIVTSGGGFDVETAIRALAATPRSKVPLFARLEIDTGPGAASAIADVRRMIDGLAPHVDAFVLSPRGPTLNEDEDEDDDALHATLVALASRSDASVSRQPRLLCLPTGGPPSRIDRVATIARQAGVDGFVVDAAIESEGSREIGRPTREAALQTVARLRESVGPDTAIVSSGGIHEPQDALCLLDAGADLVLVDSGLVFSGPGLAKRINEAVQATRCPAVVAPGAGIFAPRARAPEEAWFWALLMGLGMLFGSVLAMGIAATRVVLPYDEHFVGLTRSQLHGVNDRLLSFMAHDRVSLAGTMVSIGILYTGLSLFGMRRGQHWARVAVLTSAFAGSATFFLFLGFGYFDPFHAFVTAVLFQFLLLTLHCRLPAVRASTHPDLHDDWRWRLSQWGQLGLILQAAAFIGAGLTISIIGITSVFVPEDLEYMRTTAEALHAASRHLVPLVAHDRASLGGMLLAAGVGFLLAGLWGFRRGERWLWWTTLLAGLPGYAGAIGVHFAVGYLNPLHLAPAFAGLLLFTVSLALCFPYLGTRVSPAQG